MVKENSNIRIVERLLRLSKNQLDYNTFPQAFREEYIFLSNILHDSLDKYRNEFDAAFQKAVGEYKQRLSASGEGWFYKPEHLCWLKARICQLQWAIYGDRGYDSQIFFRDELGELAYKDLIEQIDRTALMTDEELSQHNEEINRIAEEVMNEILSEENRQPLDTK